jgi:PPM family protein phosphatase
VYWIDTLIVSMHREEQVVTPDKRSQDTLDGLGGTGPAGVHRGTVPKSSGESGLLGGACPETVYGITDTGRQRDHNEDAWLVDRDGRYFAVADGMGGHQAGEIASSTAIDVVNRRFAQDDIPAGNLKALERFMSGLCLEVHSEIQRLGDSKPDWTGMGTTLIIGYVLDSVLHTVHVGDTRCYLSRTSGLSRITSDHSVVAMMVREGLLTDDEARRHPRKNEVLQALGMPEHIIPEFHSTVLSAGDRVLFCSDGLWEALSDAEIQDVLQSDGSIRQLAQALIGRANHSGGEDNITVVLYEHILAQKVADAPVEARTES